MTMIQEGFIIWKPNQGVCAIFTMIFPWEIEQSVSSCKSLYVYLSPKASHCPHNIAHCISQGKNEMLNTQVGK
jgi:hypothetical protein